MKSSTKGCVFKSNAVEILTPRLLKSGLDELERFGFNLHVISTDSRQPEKPEIILNDLTEVEISASQKIAEAEVSASQKIAEAEVKAREIVREAEAKAGEILRESEIKAESIIQRAKMKENQLREELAKAVREEIEHLAYTEGYQTGRDKAEMESQEIREQAKSLFHMAQRVLQEEYAKVDDSLLTLAMRIAKCLTRVSLELNPQKLLEIIRSLTLLPQERAGWCLHIAPEDVDWISALPSDEQLPCPWVINETLSQGDCFLECQEGIFDARVDARLEKMEQVLREELKNEGLEPTRRES